MKLIVFAALLIATSHIVEAQTYYPPVYSGYVYTQRPAGGVDQPNAQFIRNQMEQQRQQVNIDAMQREQWNNMRNYEYINGRRDANR